MSANPTDPSAMWTKLAKFNRNANDEYITGQREKFNTESFDYPRESFWDFYSRLERYRTSLFGTRKAIDDDDILDKITEALPKSNLWQQQRSFIIREKSSLERAVIDLDAFDTRNNNTKDPNSNANSNFATANIANTSDNRGRSRGGRYNRGGRGYRGRGSYSRGNRSSGFSSKFNNTKSSNKCYFCGNTEHKQTECPAYIKAQKEAQKNNRNKRKEREDSDSEEHARIAIIASNPTFDYSYDSPNEIMRNTSILNRWCLDSGATKHFSGEPRGLCRTQTLGTPKTGVNC